MSLTPGMRGLAASLAFETSAPARSTTMRSGELRRKTLKTGGWVPCSTTLPPRSPTWVSMALTSSTPATGAVACAGRATRSAPSEAAHLHRADIGRLPVKAWLLIEQTRGLRGFGGAARDLDDGLVGDGLAEGIVGQFGDHHLVAANGGHLAVPAADLGALTDDVPD